MNKPCSERAWGPPSSAPSPSNKRDLGVRLVAASFCAPCPDPGITLTRMGPTPHKAPQPLACQAGLLDHRLCGPSSLLPCQPALQRPWGEDWRELELQASLLLTLRTEVPSVPHWLPGRDLLSCSKTRSQCPPELVWALERALWGAHSSGGCSQ